MGNDGLDRVEVNRISLFSLATLTVIELGRNDLLTLLSHLILVHFHANEVPNKRLLFEHVKVETNHRIQILVDHLSALRADLFALDTQMSVKFFNLFL